MTDADVGLVLAVVDALGTARGGLLPEIDNAEYGAAVCEVAGETVRFRVARVTPRKTGLFVAVWRRAPDGSTEPFGEADQKRLVVVTREGPDVGAFVFPAAELAARGVVSVAGVSGKRGFRVYPPWSVAESRQAAATQAWQCAHFLPLNEPTAALTRARRLFA